MDNDIINAFILSSPRSGSTVLRLTLDKLNEVISLPESHYYPFIQKNSNVKDFEMLVDLWCKHYSIKKWPVSTKDLKSYILNNQSRESRNLLELSALCYVEQYKNADPKECFIIEKSPPHIFFKKSIKIDFPKAKFVHLVRDPRDVVASLKTCTWSTTNPLVNSRVWKKGIALIESDMCVRYEDLVTDPATELQRICDFVGINYQSRIAEMKTFDEVESNNASSANSLKPISNTFVNNYMTKLSVPDREQIIVEYICKDEMKLMGYDPVLGRKDKAYRLNYFSMYLKFLMSKF